MRAVTNTREMVVLSDFPTLYDAETTVARLVEAGIPASIVEDDRTGIPRNRRVLGPRALVRPHQYDQARLLIKVLDDVDTGRSPIAPIPARSAWTGAHHLKVLGLLLAMVMLIPPALIAAAAFGLLRG